MQIVLLLLVVVLSMWLLLFYSSARRVYTDGFSQFAPVHFILVLLNGKFIELFEISFVPAFFYEFTHFDLNCVESKLLNNVGKHLAKPDCDFKIF